MTTNAGDLSRVKVHEPSDEWPAKMEIVAHWEYGNGRRGRRRAVRIDPNQFFGRGEFGAPMSGEQLLGMVDRLRKDKGKGTWYARKPTPKKAVDVIG